jgi:uncharacterized membrane protein YidH (DUF202 family)
MNDFLNNNPVLIALSGLIIIALGLLMWKTSSKKWDIKDTDESLWQIRIVFLIIFGFIFLIAGILKMIW